MRLTAERMIKAGCCQGGVDMYFRDMDRQAWDAEKLLALAIKNENFSEAAYGISYLMTKTQRVEWAIWCAERVIKIYEDKHPDDSRPRAAIKAAKAWLKNPTEGTRRAAADAYAAAAAYAADAAADATAATYAAAYAADAARKTMRIEIIKHGLEILSND